MAKFKSNKCSWLLIEQFQNTTKQTATFPIIPTRVVIPSNIPIARTMPDKGISSTHFPHESKEQALPRRSVWTFTKIVRKSQYETFVRQSFDYFDEFAPNNSFNASIKICAFMEIARASVRSACLQIIFLPLVQSRILRLMHFPTSDFQAMWLMGETIVQIWQVNDDSAELYL